MHEGYPFELVVRGSFERLRMVAEREHFRVLVATLPIVERFDDPVCLSLYDRVLDVARAQGFAGSRVVDGFKGEDHHKYFKAGERFDITHPNGAGHERMARAIADAVAPLLWPSATPAAPIQP